MHCSLLLYMFSPLLSSPQGFGEVGAFSCLRAFSDETVLCSTALYPARFALPSVSIPDVFGSRAGHSQPRGLSAAIVVEVGDETAI